jgi:U3 small nucleolar RNA-associated protein 20
LGVFASIDGPQQLVQHKLLEQIFRSFLTHQETQVVQLSLACLLKFKPKHLVPYRDLLTGILEKGKLRNALLNFQEAIEAGKIVDDHRRLLIPVITRILFGRLSVRESRSGKDSPAARRAAILSFVSMVCREDDEVFSFVYLMTRSFVPRDKKLQEVESYTASDRFEILASLHDVDAAKLNLPSGVIEGFLHLLQAVVAQLGHRIKSYIPDLTSIVLALCEVAAVAKVADVNDAGPVTTQNSESQGSNNGLRRGAIRTLCYQRLSEIFSMYSGAVDFEKFGNQLWDAIGDSVLLLPEMVVKSERVPALLHMLETLSTNASLMQLLCMHKSAVSSIIKCIASTSFTAVMTSVLTIIENLLDGAIENPESRSREIVASYVPLLMEQFASRFTSSSDPEMPAKPLPFKRAKAKLRQATWRRELRILCRISDLLEQGDQSGLGGNSTVLEDLSELLLPFLEPDSGTSDEDKLNVLGILRSTLTRVGPDTLEMVYGTLSDVLGPSKGKPGIESISVRNEVARLVVVVGEQNRDLSDIAQKVAKMSAVNSKRIDEVDFETVIPELNSLCKDNDGCEWELLAGESPMNLAPIVSICFHYLYNEDGVLSRASFNSLKTLVFVASKTSKASQIWIKLLESLVVPPTRSGLQARTVSIRRFYILIIRETAKSFNGHDSPNLCGDLSALVDEDNPDLDFFIGVTHVQIHRRGRAFQRLRKVLRESSEESAGFTSQSLSGVLLPLALHPAYESKMKAEEPFALEGIATVGAIARHLPWNKYHNTVWSILSSFDRHPEQERYLIGTLCAIIDNFSFDLTDQSDGSEDNGQYEKTAVWRALERRVIPKLEGLLIKEKSDKSGKKNKIIRPAVVLALMKLFQKFPEKFFESKLPHILAVMCDALRNRDSDARDLARTTMAKIVTGMDLKYLADVVRELTITLNEGYKVHVRVATIHTILQELLAIHKAPESGDVSGLPVSTFDSSLPALMDILQEDLFGEANERRESQDTNVRYVKEAGGSKSVHSIEIMCRMLIFKPSDASSGNISKSSVHCVVSPLLERLRLSDINASTIRKIKEIVARVVIGLSHNPSVTPAELFPFVYATIQPFIGSQKISAVLDDEEDETYDSLQVSGSGNATKKKVEAKSGKVVEWRPSTLKHARSSKAAKDSQQKERQELRRVTDGASAPKLTGSGRHGTLDASDTHNLNDPATISAVVFGLNLLLSCLRKLHLNNDEDKLTEMMDPFVPMLTACICNCKDNDVALVAMKCLMSFLRFKLPSLATCSKSLGTQALTFLSSSGSSLNQNNDMTQACFRTLTYLINRDRTSDDQTSPQPTVGGAKGEEALAANTTMPLNGEQMKVLLSFLIVSITESDQHNPALSLIKAILSRKFTSPEFYDLMESMLKLCVRSQKASLRQVRQI